MARGVIFDVDGTLVDSVDLHALAWQDAFRMFGHDIDKQAIRSQIGKGGDQLMPVFINEEELKEIGEQLEKRRGDILTWISQTRAVGAANPAVVGHFGSMSDRVGRLPFEVRGTRER